VTPPTHPSQVKAASPSLFERLVVELLLKMGYGGSRQDAGRAIGRSGDEGIDGIINEDRLGLDIIYIQAKRWEAGVGRPEGLALPSSLSRTICRDTSRTAPLLQGCAHVISDIYWSCLNRTETSHSYGCMARWPRRPCHRLRV
jgi:hypothetical protein